MSRISDIGSQHSLSLSFSLSLSISLSLSLSLSLAQEDIKICRSQYPRIQESEDEQIRGIENPKIV